MPFSPDVPSSPPMASAADSPAERPRILLWLKLLALLVIANCAASGWMIYEANVQPPASPGASASRSSGVHHGWYTPRRVSSARPPRTTGAPGPWGELTYTPITLSPPLELIPEATEPERIPVVWRFPEVTSSELTTLLMRSGVSPGLGAEVVAAAQPDEAIRGLTVRPSREMVLRMKPADRAALYVTLASFPQNVEFIDAFRYRGKSFEQWMASSPLSAETKRLIEPLIYSRGGYMFFADLESIEDALPSREDRTQLLRMLWREPTYLMHLRVTAESDISAIGNYWGKGGREKDVRALLESAATIEGGQDLPIVTFLPPFARQRLYTFPPPPRKGPATKRNCHWTAFNFFAETPDDRFCDEAEVVRTLDRDYERVFGNFQLGDVVLYVRDDFRAIHSAVYLADDVLFTKCGSASSQPWELMKLVDMRNYYPTIKPMDVQFFRRKGL
jgi:hypothetical protein